MGTVSRYAQRVPKQRYSPPDDAVAARIDHVVELYRKAQEFEADYRRELAKLTAKPGPYEVPIAHIADRLDLERKTVYRHLGRSMT